MTKGSDSYWDTPQVCKDLAGYGGDGDGMWKPANLMAAKAEVQHSQCDIKSRAKGNDQLNFLINLLIIVSIQWLVYSL